MSPIIGGFSINTPERAANAAKEGVQVVFAYGQPPAQGGILGKRLQSLHMKVIDGIISSYLRYYECNRARKIEPPPPGLGRFCQFDSDPSLTNESALLSLVTAHLQQVKDNQLVIGYWVLDDWVLWDAGGARTLLIKIHQLIQQYTPDRFAVCGFGGFVERGDAYDWSDSLADNFSPQGCDRVGLYIYSLAQSDTVPISSPDEYNWSMSGLLPKIFASLKMRGWDITKEPLIGIGQAFGGPIKNTNKYWITPNARDIEKQSRSFCEHGATGLAFYAWTDGGYGPDTQTPMNNPVIGSGIRNGITACKQYWTKHPQA
jgi:hypothetical protein